MDGAVAAAGGDGAQVGIVVRDGTRLELEVENREHYYSGLYLSLIHISSIRSGFSTTAPVSSMIFMVQNLLSQATRCQMCT